MISSSSKFSGLVSIVVPCFNEKEVLPQLISRVRMVCKNNGYSNEIVLVNDGSTDSSWDVMCGLASKWDNLVLIDLSRNHGHQIALTAGLEKCKGNRVLVMDADLQDPPELLPEMMDLMSHEEIDVVYGKRKKRAGESLSKKFTAAIFYRFLNKMTDIDIPIDTGDFRLMSRRVVDIFLSMPEQNRFVRGMISWVGFNQKALEYEREPRLAGDTKYTFIKMIRFAVDAISAFSVKPLHIVSLLSIVVSIFGFSLLIYAIISWLLFDAVLGWTSLIATVSIIGGFQLFAIGILGEYIGRIFIQVKGRPLRIIREIKRSKIGKNSD